MPRIASNPPAIAGRQRSRLGHLLFRLWGIRRLHIIGCSRSGTTMLHLAMSCFEDAVLAPFESEVFYPTLSQRLRLLRSGTLSRRQTFVTKRDFGWFRETNVARLLDVVREEDMGVLYLVRDPRDVLTSRHVWSNGARSPYVDGEHWLASIEAGESVMAALENHPRKLVLRYEDVVSAPEESQRRIGEVFGLRPRSGGAAITRIRDNLEASRANLHPHLLANVTRLRDIEPSSVGRWKIKGANMAELMGDPRLRRRVEGFIERFGYEPLSAVS